MTIQAPPPQLRRQSKRSSSIRSEAERYLVGGVNSPVRAFRHVGGHPLIVVQGRGAEVIDEARQRFVDFIMGWGALILGHQPSVVVQALRQAIAQGILMGLTHPAEMELARLIVEAIPSVEQVRFTVSGTEACMTAVRLARAHTGRSKVLLFDGGYHGHGDSMMAGKTAGLPSVVTQDTITVPLNDRDAFEAAVRRHADQLACVIIEPVAANTGVIAPTPGSLEAIRDLTQRHGIVLIFDEVVTGFRLSLGGAQELFGVRPDLTTFGKIIGGGLPIGALGGPKRLMQRLAPVGDVYHGGTFAGHPLSMAAGIATLRTLRAHPPYRHLEQFAQHIHDELLTAASETHIPVQINRVGSMLTLFFSRAPITNAAQAKASQREAFGQWARLLRREGVLVPPSPFEALFVSTAHQPRHMDRLRRATRKAFRSMRAGTG